ncbi:DNA primase [Streptomyces sp. NBC_00210]|uniref:DNA primase n=1 Tax=unclassified Streptomyces TaxID=2593676 RepID=UPI0032498D54
MNNSTVLGLAMGAGYLLGRTKKAKLAFAVGTLVAGKQLPLNPKALGGLVGQQLQNNPQFKALGDQLREDLRGVGKAATGALVNRQLEGIADRLHERTLGVQDRIDGVVPHADDEDETDGETEDEDEIENENEDEDENEDENEDEDETKEKAARQERPERQKKTTSGRKAPAKKTTGTARRTPRKAVAKKAASKGGRSDG